MVAHCSRKEAVADYLRHKPSLEWDEYDEAAFEMWEICGTYSISPRMLQNMADRLRELFVPREQ